MGRTAKSAQGDRAGEREARIAKAKQRRLELDKEARDARIVQTLADVCLAQDERHNAAKVTETADAKTGPAILRILAEGVPMAQVAELTELSVVNHVQKLKAAAVESTEMAGEPGKSGQSVSAGSAKVAPSGQVSVAQPGGPECAGCDSLPRLSLGFLCRNLYSSAHDSSG
jgi:hypothetical protein